MPPVSKTWVAFGSEKEIDERNFTDRRPLVCICIHLAFIYCNNHKILRLKLKYEVQVLKESLNRQAHFSDVECDEKKGLITIAPYEDSSFNTKMLEMEKAVQVKKRFHIYSWFESRIK